MKTHFSFMLLGLIILINGCSSSDSPADSDQQTVNNQVDQQSTESDQSGSTEHSESANSNEKTNHATEELPVITFGSDTTNGSPTSMKSPKSSNESAEGAVRSDQVIATLKDLQILLGTWRGITRKNFDGAKNVDETNWVWDFKTDPDQPALVMSSEKSPYYQQARLTFLPESEEYQLELTTSEGKSVELVGEFVEEIHDETGEDGKPQRTYKLQFTQPADQDRSQRLVFNQQNNNRYLLEVYEQRSGSDQFFRVDTVSTQREGTSMALIDEGYGERTCIISGGLGTITVSYQGQTYYVCCTGCKAAFDEDPERWIARAEQQKK